MEQGDAPIVRLINALLTEAIATMRRISIETFEKRLVWIESMVSYENSSRDAVSAVIGIEN